MLGSEASALRRTRQMASVTTHQAHALYTSELADVESPRYFTWCKLKDNKNTLIMSS